MSEIINKHLECVLKSHNMNLDEGTLLDNYKSKRDKVKEALEKEYGDKIIKIINSGSYKKHTAINVKFDMDLCVHFKSDSFKTLKEMYESVYNFLKDNYKKDDVDLMEIREQRVSVGLLFDVDDEKILFDVTPGREFNDDNTDNDINLYMNIGDTNSKKTNIQKQIDTISGRDKERHCIKFLKVWKFYHDVKIKSFLVELLVMETFDINNIDNERGHWNRLKKTIEFIRDNIETIQLKDPGNSNNIVTDSLQSDEKTSIKDLLEEMLEKIGKDENKIKYYFPINSKYPCEEKKQGYEQNTKSNSSILSTKSFG